MRKQLFLEDIGREKGMLLLFFYKLYRLHDPRRFPRNF